MTEKFEIEALIEDLEYVKKELNYEANIHSGNGQEFTNHLNGAKKFVILAMERLKDAISLFDDPEKMSQDRKSQLDKKDEIETPELCREWIRAEIAAMLDARSVRLEAKADKLFGKIRNIFDGCYLRERGQR